MARWLGRIVLILGALVAPLWVGALVLDLEDVVREVVSSVVAPTPGSTANDAASMSPADCPEEDVSAVAEIDDDDLSPAKVLPPPVAIRLHPADRCGAACFGARAGAAPPLVHLEVQTPPPRS